MISFACPNLFIHLFMRPTQQVLQMAPAIIRVYAISFLLLPLNIFSTYYFQALLKAKVAFIVSVARGCMISGICIILLPILFNPNAIWWTMPITETLVAVFVIIMIRRYTKALLITLTLQNLYN